MIHSRNANQYDPSPFIDQAGERFSLRNAPADAREKARSIFVPEHLDLDTNPILANIRLLARDSKQPLGTIAKSWVSLLGDISHEILIAITPNLDHQKIADAKKVLERLVNISSAKEGKVAHG